MQRHQIYHNYQQLFEQELAEESELQREYRELRLNSRINCGLIDIDAQSTLSDGLLWVTDSIDTITEVHRYQDYIYDGGTEAMDRYMLDFDNLRPSVSNMQRPAYKEWYRNNIYNRSMPRDGIYHRHRPRRSDWHVDVVSPITMEHRHLIGTLKRHRLII